MSPILAVAAVVLQAGASSSGWKSSTTFSKADDSSIVTLSRRGDQAFRGWPDKLSRPELVLRCKEGRTQVFVKTGMAANVESGADGVTALIRLDKQSAIETMMEEATSKDALFFTEPGETFIEALIAAKTLFFRFTPFNSAPQETTFSLTGLSAVIGPLQKACGWDPEAVARRRAEAQLQAKNEAERKAREAKDKALASLDTLISNLDSKSAIERAMAAQALATSANLDELDPERLNAIVRRLIVMLSETNLAAKGSAAKALGAFGGRAREALPALEHAVEADPEIRMDAQEAAAKIRKGLAVP